MFGWDYRTITLDWPTDLHVFGHVFGAHKGLILCSFDLFAYRLAVRWKCLHNEVLQNIGLFGQILIYRFSGRSLAIYLARAMHTGTSNFMASDFDPVCLLARTRLPGLIRPG